MANVLDFLIRLGDQWSGPAAKIASVNDNMTDSINKATRATNVFRDAQGRARDASGRFLKGIGKGFTDAEKALDPWLARINPKTPMDFLMAPKKLSGFTRIVQEVGKAFGPRAANMVLRFGASMEKVVPVVQAVAPAVMTLGAVGGAMFVGASALAFAGAKFVVDAQSFKQSTLTAFKLMLGSQQAGEAFFQEAIKFAAETPFETSQVIGGFKALTGGGFKQDEVKQVMSAVGDVAALQNFDPIVIQRMILAINQIKGKGRLAAEELNQIVEASGGTVARVKVYETLAKQLGKTKAEIIKLAETGKISADQGIAAILESIRTTISGGKLGGLMKELSTQIPGLLSTLKGRPEELIFAIPEDKLKGLEMIRSFLVDLNDLLDPASASGKELASALGGAFDAFTRGLLGPSKEENKKALKGGIEGMTEALKNAQPALEELGASIRDIGKLAGFFLSVGNAAADFNKSLSSLGTAGQAVSNVFGGVFKFAIGGPLMFIIGLAMDAVEQFKALFAVISGDKPLVLGPWGEAISAWLNSIDTSSIGTNIINGIVNGITSGASSVVGAINSVTTGAIDAAKQTLGIASPSKVFEQLGQFSMAGYAQGVSNDNSVAPAVSGMLTPPAVAAGGGAPMGSVVVNVNVMAGKNAEETGEIVGRTVRRELLAVVQELALSRGAAA